MLSIQCWVVEISGGPLCFVPCCRAALAYALPCYNRRDGMGADDTQSMKTHKRFVEIIALVVLVCFGLIAMEWSYRQPRTAAFTMDSPTVMLPRDGLLNLERFPDFPAVYRWSVG